jgi:hypothetical protein
VFFYIILISGMWDISGDAHEPLDGVGIELAELSLDEPDLEVDLYLDGVVSFLDIMLLFWIDIVYH